jgi:hypothetical protein
LRHVRRFATNTGTEFQRFTSGRLTNFVNRRARPKAKRFWLNSLGFGHRFAVEESDYVVETASWVLGLNSMEEIE